MEVFLFLFQKRKLYFCINFFTLPLGKNLIIMKKTLYSILTLLFLAQNLFSQVVNIPDEIFKNALLKYTKINTNADNEIQVSEAIAYTDSINVTFKLIKDLTGIEAFVNIRKLDCGYNELTTLDMSKNTALIVLNCYINKLTTLNISKNTVLTYLDCTHNQLSTLDVSKNIALTYLACIDDQLATLDISKNTALTYLNCYGNKLTTLDISKNTALTYLNCYDNKLTTLDISKNTALTYLDCNNNQLNNLDVSKNTALTKLYCNNNQLKNLNIKNSVNSKLSAFDARKNPLLKCIQIDDIAKIGTAWQKDDTATYSTTCNVSTEDAFATLNLTLYPNPASTSLALRWEGDITSVNIDLFNAQGRLIQSQNVVNQGNINVENLPKGLYLCQIKDEKKVVRTEKVVIE
jgi:Leucine-rich repeat (LRR) protein